MRTVLVLDDEQSCVNLAKSVLEQEFKIVTALSLKEARVLLTHENNIDIILCDHELGDGLGLDFLCELEKNHSHTVKILLTGLMNESLFSKSINECSLFRYIAKPYLPNELLESVRLAAIKCDVDEQEEDINDLKKKAHQRYLKNKKFNELEKAQSSFFKALLKGTGQWLTVVFIGAIFVIFLIYILKSVLGIDFLP